MPGAVGDADRDVLADGEAMERLDDLERAGHPGTRDRPRLRTGDVDTVDEHPARGGPQVAGHQVHQRALDATVGSDHYDDPDGRNREGHIGQHLKPTEATPQPFSLQYRRGGGRTAAGAGYGRYGAHSR